MATTKRERVIRKAKLTEAKKDLTRAKALRELNLGADFNNDRYTKHRNRHVRDRAWHLAGAVVPDNDKEKQNLFEVLSKGCTAERVEALKVRFGLKAA